MVQRKFPALIWMILLGSLVVVIGLMGPDTANAQCGSSASSCKNCHEVQAEYPVNNDGTSWHQAHAFGDFCEFCHAGNVQATDKDEAHTGMEYPLENINASCLSCHPSDVNERAEVYATALGVTIGSSGDGGGGTTAVSSNEAPAADTAPAPESDTAADTAVSDPVPDSDSGAIMDYNRQYELTVLNQREPINVGNVILTILLVGLTGLAAYLIWRWEGLGTKWRELRGVPMMDGSGAAVLPSPLPRTAVTRPQPPARPAAPSNDPLNGPLAQMRRTDPEAAASLARLLERPQGWSVIRAVGRIDSRLVTAVHQLDPTDRDLLIAIVKELDKEKGA
ncbi:MAG: hypothetical protein P8183_14240 [Anaerolineae bacterium]